MKVKFVRTDDTIVHVPSFIRSSEGKGYQNIAVMLTNKPSHINIILITLAQVSTMLKNLAAPELDELIKQIDDLRDELISKQDVA